MPLPGVPVPKFDSEPYVTIRRSGRHSWGVAIHSGLLIYGPDTVYGSKERAERIAHKRFTRWLARKERQAEVYVVAGQPPPKPSERPVPKPPKAESR